MTLKCFKNLPIALLACGLVSTHPAFSQTENTDKFVPAIEDNSMFIEEAYNQEERVVQHISNLVFLPNLEDNFYYSFTQEWPVFSIKHQLSYSLQYTSLNKGKSTGLGDIMLNYRYQLSYKQDFAACSPRISLIIPTGNEKKGLGNGSWGMQICLPISKRWSNQFVTHLDLGTTYLFKVKQDDIGFNRSMWGYYGGFSTIWLLSANFNLMLECLTTFTPTPQINNKVTYSNTSLLAPAFRYAINFKNLQIVPGLSLPFTLTEDSKTEMGAMVYLSFEHGF